MQRTLTVPLTAMATYRAMARRHKEREHQALVRRRARAWELARRAAMVLREHFSASRVVVFGSLVHADCFTLWSDVDIAAWGIAAWDTFRAIGAVHDLGADLELNLVDVEACRPTLLGVIEAEGIDL